jgi:quercetin dioxygenase-like cupin family protein
MMRAKIVNIENVNPRIVPWGITKIIVNSSVGAKNIEVRLTEMMPGQVHELHEHNAEEVIIILSGKGLHVEENEEEQDINPNDVVYIPPGVKHKHECIGTEKLRVIVFFAHPIT